MVVIFRLIVFLLFIFLTPTMVYAQTVSTYSDSGCTTPATTFSQNDMVYGYATGLNAAQEYTFYYYRPDSSLACSNTYSGVTAVCDSTGCLADALGTWTLELVRTAGGKLEDSTTYDVSADEFLTYLGAGLILLLSSLIYFFLRKNLSPF